MLCSISWAANPHNPANFLAATDLLVNHQWGHTELFLIWNQSIGLLQLPRGDNLCFCLLALYMGILMVYFLGY